MPYIKPECRELYDREIDLILNKLQDGGFPEGDVVYILYRLVVGWWVRSSGRFKDINHIRGTLHSTLHEFDRRIADTYENAAIVKNGDVTK